MHNVIEAVIDKAGHVHLPEPAQVRKQHHALVIILDDAGLSTAALEDTAEWKSADLRYQTSRPFREGGMGQIFLETDPISGQRVCIKQLHAGLPSRLLWHEWKSLARIDSEYVVRFLDRFERNGVLHVVMEYIDGPDLSQWWGSRKATSSEVIWLGLCLMRGVAAIHEHGVIHCDLKPHNILVEDRTQLNPNKPAWIARVIDFGLAILDQYDADGVLTAEGRIAGTPAYIAPEQARGELLTPACDIYAAGLILREAIMGKRAFTGDARSIVRRKASGKGDLEQESWPGSLHTELTDLVDRCTGVDPSSRPTASEAAEWLAGLE